MARFDMEKCNSCKDMTCVSRCIFGGIKIQGGKFLIDPESCWGCALCTTVCSHNAVVMEEIRGEDHIPLNKARFFEYDSLDMKK